jgi:hypothetical protein
MSIAATASYQLQRTAFLLAGGRVSGPVPASSFVALTLAARARASVPMSSRRRKTAGACCSTYLRGWQRSAALRRPRSFPLHGAEERAVPVFVEPRTWRARRRRNGSTTERIGPTSLHSGLIPGGGADAHRPNSRALNSGAGGRGAISDKR